MSQQTRKVSQKTLDLYASQEVVERKIKLRAYAVTIDNTDGRPPLLIYHEERVTLEGAERKAAERKAAERTGELRVSWQEAAPAAYQLANGAIVSGADVAEWLVRDYVARKSAQPGGGQ